MQAQAAMGAPQGYPPQGGMPGAQGGYPGQQPPMGQPPMGYPG